MEYVADGRATSSRRARSSSAVAPSTARRSCCSPGSGPPRTSTATASRWSSDLPGVGGNLQDHLAAGAPSGGPAGDLYDHENLRRLMEWQVLGRGPLTSPIAEGCAFVRTRSGLPAPDLQLHVAPVPFLDNARSEPAYPGFTIGATLVDVASRGRLRLAAARSDVGAADRPELSVRALDLDTLVAGVRLAREIGGEAIPCVSCSSRRSSLAGTPAMTTTSPRRSARTARRSITRSGPARWVLTSQPSSTWSAVFAVLTDSALSTRRSCQPCRGATRTPRPSRSQSVRPT